MQDHESPTSKADVQGNITYVNQDFINISGFREGELMGAPQTVGTPRREPAKSAQVQARAGAASFGAASHPKKLALAGGRK